MGNSLRGDSLLCNKHFPNHIKLGSCVSIDLTEQEIDNDEETSKVWSVSYSTVDGSRCVLNLWRYFSRARPRMKFQLRDDICSGGHVDSTIEKTEDDLLDQVIFYDARNEIAGFNKGAFNKNVSLGSTFNMSRNYDNRRSDIKPRKTDLFYYASRFGSKAGLLVTEGKLKKAGDEEPYKITMTHYYAVSTGHIYSKRNRIDIGLSMKLNIWVSKNHDLDFTVEGPVLHPSSALFYMFEQVSTTKTWTPTACPHCDDIQRRRGVTSSQSDSQSEDSDDLPPTRRRGPWQYLIKIIFGNRRQIRGNIDNRRDVVGNHGIVQGNNNGNLNATRFIYIS